MIQIDYNEREDRYEIVITEGDKERTTFITRSMWDDTTYMTSFLTMLFNRGKNGTS